MNYSTIRAACALVLIGALCACGGGGGSAGSSLPKTISPIGNPSSGQTQNVALSIRIPVASTASTVRRPQFISSATNGATLTLTEGGAPQTTVVNLSNASPNCTVGEGGRTCSVNLTMVPGDVTVAITTYDAAPVGGSIPETANELGTGSVTQTITSAAGQQILLFVGGLIAGIGEQPTFGSVAADGRSHSIGFTIDPVDFDNTPITAGVNDPYANPITVTLNESGGDGNSHAHLMVNGVNVGSSTTLTESSQTLALCYDGGSTPGYSATVTLSVPGVGSEGTQISPMFVAQSGAVTRQLTLQGSASNADLTVTEYNAPEGQSYSANAPENCSGIATAGPVSGSGASASVLITGGATPSTSGCMITIQDGNGTTICIPVTNTPLNGHISIAGVNIAEYGVGGSPGPIVLGPDGNMWFTQQSALEYISADGSTTSQTSDGNADFVDLTLGSDGALWATDKNDGGVDRITTTGQVANYPFTMASCGIITAVDGTMWVTDNNGNLYNLDIGGLYTLEQSFEGGPTHLVQGPDGAIWVVNSGSIDRYSPSDSSFTSIPVPDEDAAHDITVGPDGAIWFTASNGDQPFIGRIPMNGDGPFTVTTFPLPGGSDPRGIVGGIDNAVWYTDDSSGGSIGRVSTVGSNAMTSYAVPVSGDPLHITLGADGTLWFTDVDAGEVGHVTP